MAHRTVQSRRVIRTRRAPAAEPAQPLPQELSDYEQIEVRSRELEAERARGGSGASQPPESDTPLLYPSSSQGHTLAAREADRTPADARPEAKRPAKKPVRRQR